MSWKTAQYPLRRSCALIASCVLFVLICVALAAAQNPQNEKLRISDQALTNDQIAVYRVILQGWSEANKFRVNLSVQTDPIDSIESRPNLQCGKDLALEPAQAGLVHRFREEDVSRLGVSGLRLVDPDRQKREVAKNDPGKAIAEGRTVDDAVENGFTHGLFTLGEVRFDKDHQHAIVSFGFFCGGLCGHGETLLLIKKDDAWKVVRACGEWQS